MIVEGKLRVFEDFVVDRELPKYKKPSDEAMDDDFSGRISVNNSSIVFSESWGEKSADFSEEASSELSDSEERARLIRRVFIATGPNPHSKALPLWARFYTWARSFFAKAPPVPALPPPMLSVEEFFSAVKNTVEELAVVQGRAAGYEQALLDARRGGQQALLEKLKAGLNAHRMEAQLLAIGLPKSLSEANLVKFYKQSKKGLRLDWVKNFTRVIPTEILDRKERADALGIFDNYVVLHYDPLKKSFEETEKEREARKDPILFGLIKGRRQLYFVGDWIDELCDLSLDQIADALGKDTVQSVGGLLI